MKKITFSLLVAIMFSLPAQASWTLNGDESTLSFISTKAVNVAEIHKFTTLTGGVDDTGNVVVSIALASVDTGIEIRDDRMREMLFDTANYSSATMTAQVNMTMVDELSSGESKAMAVEGELALHGQSTLMTFEVVVARMSDGNLLVMSQKPVVVNAPLFNLADGVEALREVAGLPSISAAVPVSFVLSFDAN
jgi:polyisoprenoid-binding protein YceI